MDYNTLNASGSDNQLDTNPEEPLIPIFLTQAKASPLTTLHLEYINDLPDYPTSHVDGYTYVVALEGQSQAEAEQLVHDIQYNRHLLKCQKRPVYCPFLGCHTRKWTWRCSGIIACEYLSPALLSYHHTSVNEAVWQQMQEYQKNIEVLQTNQGKRNAYSYYRSKLAFFKKGYACIDQLPTCKPIFKRQPRLNVLGENDPYIGCINETSDFLNKHHRGAIQGHTVLDLAFLEDLFNKEILPPTEKCVKFEPMTTRRKFCDLDHVQGPGRLVKVQCDVIFNAMVPVDITRCPFLLFTSHGIHKHPPPPPNKAPERILQGVKKIIEQIRDPSLTTAQFLRSPQLEAFCQQNNASTLSEIHSAFSNKDRIAAIIQKQRLLSYPKGQDIDGLIFLQNIDLSLKDYIQEYYHDSQGTMVICGYKEQIQLLSNLSSFEVDMSYKRLRSKDMNEVLFATFLPDQCKIITLLRIFTTEGYYLLFKRVFNLIQQITQRPVLFDPIHGSGIYGIIVDMDTKQYTGLGQYLAEIDPRHRDSTWHIRHIIIFCRVHFQRTILKAIGSRQQGSALWSRMISLLECKSEEDYDTLIDLLIKYEDEKVQNWAIQKKSPIIKAGLIKACSGIQPYYFDQLRHHTNAVEQSHQKSYASGKYLSLIDAVKNSAKLDKDDILQYNAFQQLNIHHSYRTSNMETNYLRHMSRERGRKRRRSALSSYSENQSERSFSQSRRSISHLSSQNSEDRSNRSTQSEYIPRSQSQPRGRGGNRSSVSSSAQSLRRVSSQNIVSAEQERQNIELQERKLQLKEREESLREKQLKNEEKELELMERRAKLQDLLYK